MWWGNLKARLVIWVALCLICSIVFFGKLWASLPQWLSPEGLQRYGVFHWGVLGLCILWLWLKRKDILPRMRKASFSLPFVLGGLALLVISIFLPKSDNFLVFFMLLGWLGIFTIIFAQASFMPAVLLAIYGLSVLFPLLAAEWLGEPSTIVVGNIVVAITQVLGLPINREGQVLHFTSLNGDAISTTLSAECAGYVTIGVFIALFSLMMLDIRLPLSRAWYVFLLGLAGTWIQNILRIVVTLVAAYYWGSEVLDAVHYNIAYVIFPLWFALFAFWYLKLAGYKPHIHFHSK